MWVEGEINMLKTRRKVINPSWKQNGTWTSHEHQIFKKTYRGLTLRKVIIFSPYYTLLIYKQNNIELTKIFNVPKWESQKFSILLNYEYYNV
jgi:hypothetical protein